jgi:Na+/melibiose symporter-like transporter
MYIGLGIFLIVVGAILTFALHASLGAVDLNAVGWICMVAGVLAIVLSLIVTRRRVGSSGYTARRVSHQDPATGSRVDEVDVDRGL